MSNISGLGYGLMDLDALKKLSQQQNVNGEKANKKEQGVSNVFEEAGGIGSAPTSEEATFSDNIPEITAEDIDALEHAYEAEKEEPNEKEEKSAIQSLTEAVQNLVNSLLPSKGGIGTPGTTVSPTGVDNLKFNKDINTLFIAEDATVSELEQLKQKTINDYSNEINGKKTEKDNFIASQESKKASITSKIEQQKSEINNTKNEITSTENNISDTESQISATESEISSLQAALSSINNEDEGAAQKKSAIEAKIQELEAKKSELETKKSELETKKSELEQELATIEQGLATIETELKNVEMETNQKIQVFEQEISSLENSKNSEVSKIDLKIAQARAKENSAIPDKENENEPINIFIGV